MNYFFKNLVAIAILAVPVLALNVVEDSKNRFIANDEVMGTEIFECENSRGAYFLPEKSAYENGNGMPFRIYPVALPTSDIPQVSVSDEATLPLGKNWCSDSENGIVDTLKFKAVSASMPYFRDGLWITDVKVPLYEKKGNSVSLRKKFRIRVDFARTASGVNPGTRALGRVVNGKGAARFGVSLKRNQKLLRKEAANTTSDVNFLAQFSVGDKNLGSFSEDGLYAVDFKSIRTALLAYQREGELESGIPVEKICVYGASPDTLSAVGPGNAERNPNKIFEIPIEVRDHSPNGSGADGIFNDGDTLVFVGYGNAFWKRCDSEDSTFVNGKMDYFHSYSPYSFYQGFLFGWKNTGKGMRLSNLVKAASGTGKSVPWMRYVRAEKEMILRDTYFGKDLDWESATGKEWFWLWHSEKDSTHVDASTLRTDETSTLKGLVDGGNQYVAASYFPHRSTYASNVVVENMQSGNQTLSGSSYSVRMNPIHFAFDVNGVRVDRSNTTLIPGGNFRIDGIKLKSTGNLYTLDMLPNQEGFDRFDGYSVAYEWTPSTSTIDSAEWLLPGAVSGVIKVPVPSGIRVMKFVNLAPVGFLASSNGFATDSVSASDDVRYLAVRENSFRTGVKISAIPATNASALNDITRPNSKLEYLILAPSDYVSTAVSLAEFRSSGEAATTLATSVVNVDDVYRAYTAGRLSPVAIRNYISYVYSVCPNLRYVLLVGVGNYDYRGLNSRLTPNVFPPYEIEDGVYEDFYATLDSGEVIQYGVYDLDVAVGRIPVQSVEEFVMYVAKAKEYEKLGSMDNSNWRSTLLLAADDAFNNGAMETNAHTRYQEDIARLIDSLSTLKKIRWTMKKIYLLNYESDASGQKKTAADDFLNILNQGALFTTYYGHGSKTDWAGEGLFKPSYISKLSNKGRYTILGSFACTVGRFDEGGTRSLSEEMILASGAGSIASIGASRESFARFNGPFGSSLLEYALVDSARLLGDAYLLAKRNEDKSFSLQRYNNERYVLLGEPVIHMPTAEYSISLDNTPQSIKALDKMTLSGTIDGMESGYIHLTLNEGRTTKNMSLQIGDTSSVDVFYDGSLIYSEDVPVKNGRFSTEFVTPKKMTFGDTAAEFRAWAYSSNNAPIGRKWLGGLKISGMSSYADSIQDTVPPTIQIQSCYAGGLATAFTDGQTVKLQSPACLSVVVEDSTSLDYREQADEGLTFEVVGVKDQFHPWPYVEQTSKRAKAKMNFATAQYPAGKYVFKVRALDVVGNVATKTLNVEITEDMETGLADVFNAPNPMGRKGTTFYFKNLAVDRNSKVDIFIYNQNGKLVRVLKNAESGVTHWNGHDEHGRMLANGLYHYIVRSVVSATEDFGKKTWTKKQKLVISR